MSCGTALLLGVGLLLMGPGSLAQTTGLAPYGEGGCGSDFVPTFHSDGEMPVLGNAAFRLVAENLTGGAPGFVFLSARATDWAALGLRIYMDPSVGLGVACQAGGLAGLPGDGALRLPLPIPSDPALAGGRLFAQGFFVDAFTPSSLVHTHGLGIAIEPVVPPLIAVLQDRLNYQAFFATATQPQAEVQGRALWAANQVPGFVYARTERFASGGETHWMAIVVHSRTGMEFCLIPGGTFRMGDINRTGWNAELPVRRVRVAPFLIARTEVTQAQFSAIMGSTPWQGKRDVVVGPDYPATFVDWNDAAAFCSRAGLRLPSEAEWEYACRGGVEACYSYGENFPPNNLGNHAWYDANALYGNRRHAQLVAGKPPNSFGLFDMHGNVYEWCQERWHDDLKCAPPDGGEWTGTSTLRVMRGGAWTGYDLFCRSSTRGWLIAIFRSEDLGFRPAASLR